MSSPLKATPASATKIQTLGVVECEQELRKGLVAGAVAGSAGAYGWDWMLMKYVPWFKKNTTLQVRLIFGGCVMALSGWFGGYLLKDRCLERIYLRQSEMVQGLHHRAVSPPLVSQSQLPGVRKVETIKQTEIKN